MTKSKNSYVEDNYFMLTLWQSVATEINFYISIGLSTANV